MIYPDVGMIKYIFKEVKGIEYDDAERMSWEDAMWIYGNDKPTFASNENRQPEIAFKRK
jgi:aspartyl-tRNA synthetase